MKGGEARGELAAEELILGDAEDSDAEGGVEDEGDGGGDQGAPHEGRRDEQQRLLLVAVEPQQDEPVEMAVEVASTKASAAIIGRS